MLPNTRLPHNPTLRVLSYNNGSISRTLNEPISWLLPLTSLLPFLHPKFSIPLSLSSLPLFSPSCDFSFLSFLSSYPFLSSLLFSFIFATLIFSALY